MIWLITQIWILLLVSLVAGIAVGYWIANRDRSVPLANQNKSPSTTENVTDTNIESNAREPGDLVNKLVTDADDLTQIIGVSEATSKTLNALGIYYLKQIASWSDENAHWIESKLNEPGRISREQWTEQAANLVDSE